MPGPPGDSPGCVLAPGDVPEIDRARAHVQLGPVRPANDRCLPTSPRLIGIQPVTVSTRQGDDHPAPWPPNTLSTKWSAMRSMTRLRFTPPDWRWTGEQRWILSRAF